MKIAIMTNFVKSKPEYSLYGVVLAQADALQRQGNDVTIFVGKAYQQTQPLPPRFEAKFSATVPIIILRDYRDEKDISKEHLAYVEVLKDFIKAELLEFDVIFTHDWVFTGWNLPYFLALEQTRDETIPIKFLHWIHSIPGIQRSWWQLRRLGEKNHRLIYPNKVSAFRVATAFLTEPSMVLTIPHIVDIRDLFPFDNLALEFLDEYPQMLDSAIVQVYPAGSDRLDAKGVREVILLFSRMKERGYSVFLLIANQHADRPDVQEKIKHLIRIGRRSGLKYKDDFVFTSEEDDRFREGVPKATLINLMQLSTVFIYPTQEETFGLTLPEVLLSSGALPVLNKSLAESLEVGGYNGLVADFGSYSVDFKPLDEGKYFDHLAGLICAQLLMEEGIKARKRFLSLYNKTSIYCRYYSPILEGSALW